MLHYYIVSGDESQVARKMNDAYKDGYRFLSAHSVPDPNSEFGEYDTVVIMELAPSVSPYQAALQDQVALGGSSDGNE